MGDFHYDDATIARGPKSQPPTTVGTHQASHSTVRSGFSLAQKTLAPPTDDDTQPSQSAPRSPDEKQHGPSATKSAGKPMPPPSVDTNNQPPPASQGVHLDTASLAAATSNNAQTQGPVHREIPPGSTHYDIRNNIVVNLTYNAPPPQMHLPEQPFKPTNGQQSGARSKAVHVDDAEERTSHNNQASSPSSSVRVFCSLMFAVELVNVAFFACYVDAHKAGRDEAYSFGIGFLITACLMTGITLLDMVNAFCAKNGCWYVLSACFWWIGGCIYFVIGLTFLFMYTVYWASACSVKYPGESYCPAMLIAPAWIFNLPLFVLIPIYVFSLMNAA